MLLDHGDPAMEIPGDAQKHSPQIRWAVGVVCNVWREFSINPLPIRTCRILHQALLGSLLCCPGPAGAERPTSSKEWIEESRKKRNR